MGRRETRITKTAVHRALTPDLREALIEEHTTFIRGQMASGKRRNENRESLPLRTVRR